MRIYPQKSQVRVLETSARTFSFSWSASGLLTGPNYPYSTTIRTPCGTVQTNSQSASATAYAGETNFNANLYVSDGSYTYTISLSGISGPIFSGGFSVSEPVHWNLYRLHWADLYSDFSWAATKASIDHGDFNTFTLSAYGQTACNTTAWYPGSSTSPGDDITITITGGSLYGHMELNGIPMSDPFTVQAIDIPNIKFVADGIQPLSGPGVVTVQASIQVAHLSHEVSFNVNCALQPERYSQGAMDGTAPWYNDYYDHTANTIKQSGCALTCVAMVLNAFGYPYMTPGELNAVMNSKATKNAGGYEPCGDMNWKIANVRANIPAEIERTGYFPIASKASDPTVLDNNLPDNCRIPIVQVRHKRSDGTWGMHYVLVYGKVGSDYFIFDPGDGTKSKLSQYEGKFWNYVIYNLE